VSIGVAIVLSSYLEPQIPWLRKIFGKHGTGFPLSLLLSLGVFPAVLLLPYVLAVAFDFGVVKPLAWMLTGEQLSRGLKVISTVMLVVGFHFDLLAS
jgi:hypothetical protein